MDYAKEAFIAAVAACALVAFVSPTRAQEAKKESAPKEQQAKQHLEMAKSAAAAVK